VRVLDQPEGNGEPLAVRLRAGNAGSNTGADHITVARQALAPLPGQRPGSRPGRKVLIRTDGAGAGHALLTWLHGQRLSYSIGFGLAAHTADLLPQIPPTCGRRPTTPTTRCATAPGSPNSPDC
jgi:hypothetical protein